jgi:hypothetical protein
MWHNDTMTQHDDGAAPPSPAYGHHCNATMAHHHHNDNVQDHHYLRTATTN